MLARRHQKSAPRTAPTAAAAKPSTVGDVGKRGGGMWAALADSDTDSDTEPREARHCAHLAVDAEVSVPSTCRADGRSGLVAAALSVSVPKKEVPTPLPSTAEASSTVASLFDDPLFAAMDRGEVRWGDLLLSTEPLALAAIPVTPERDPLSDLWTNPSSPLRATEGELWEQPFAADLDEYWPETYDTRAMSDTDFHAMMAWLYSKGWCVDNYDRQGVRCWPDNASSRRWDPAAMAAEGERHIRWADEEPPAAPTRCCGGAGHRAPKPKHSSEAGGYDPSRPARGAKAPVTIPRFCREGHACAAEGCRYVHGDTIPRVNEPCAFGAGCGASDPTGVKRSQCLRMHPGEVWTPELVIRRL